MLEQIKLSQAANTNNGQRILRSYSPHHTNEPRPQTE